MEEKNINQKDKKQRVPHFMTGIFAVVKDDDGEIKEVDMRKIVGSKKEEK